MEVNQQKKSKWKKVAVGLIAAWFMVCAVRVLFGLG